MRLRAARRPGLLANDRAMIDPLGSGELRLCGLSQDQHTHYVVELSRQECEHIAEWLGWRHPGAPPPWSEEED
jgi:hypothetical protein